MISKIPPMDSIYLSANKILKQISIDEAYIDLTGTEKLLGPAIKTAKEIKKRIIHTTGITISIGIAPNYYLAKLASEAGKPDGLYEVKKGDLVISQRGTLGLIASIPNYFENAIISANFIAIKKLKDISAEYLRIFLNSKYVKTQLIRKTSGQIQTKITTDDIKLIKVPIPPLKIQNKIVETIESAFKTKEQK